MGGSVEEALFVVIMLRPLAKCDLNLKKGISFTNERDIQMMKKLHKKWPNFVVLHMVPAVSGEQLLAGRRAGLDPFSPVLSGGVGGYIRG